MPTIVNCERAAGRQRHGLRWRDPVTGARRTAFYASPAEREANRPGLELQISAERPAEVERPRAVVRWLGAVAQYLTRPGVRVGTRREAERILTDFSNVCRVVYLMDATPAALAEYLAARRQGLPELRDRTGRPRQRRLPSEATIGKERRTLAGFWAWAARSGMAAGRNPFAGE